MTELFEALVERIHDAVRRSEPPARDVPRFDADRMVVVTGARGFLGSAITRALSPCQGHQPRRLTSTIRMSASGSPPISAAGLPAGRSPDRTSSCTPPRKPPAATRRISATASMRRDSFLHAMHADGVSKLVLVSSLSVIRPPRTPWERQDERTPRPAIRVRLAPYTWGKSLQEALVEREAAALGIATRIHQAWARSSTTHNPELPGLMGRRLVGRWHLGLGRPGLPIAVCDVDGVRRSHRLVRDALRRGASSRQPL